MSEPWRFTLYWTAAVDADEAEILFGSVEDWVGRGGGHVEGGSMRRMKDEDVVEDSPLAIDLRTQRGKPHGD